MALTVALEQHDAYRPPEDVPEVRRARFLERVVATLPRSTSILERGRQTRRSLLSAAPAAPTAVQTHLAQQAVVAWFAKTHPDVLSQLESLPKDVTSRDVTQLLQKAQGKRLPDIGSDGTTGVMKLTDLGAIIEEVDAQPKKQTGDRLTDGLIERAKSLATRSGHGQGQIVRACLHLGMSLVEGTATE